MIGAVAARSVCCLQVDAAATARCAAAGCHLRRYLEEPRKIPCERAGAGSCYCRGEKCQFWASQYTIHTTTGTILGPKESVTNAERTEAGAPASAATDRKRPRASQLDPPEWHAARAQRAYGLSRERTRRRSRPRRRRKTVRTAARYLTVTGVQTTASRWPDEQTAERVRMYDPAQQFVIVFLYHSGAASAYTIRFVKIGDTFTVEAA